ncbi:FprA family A-type flavoprotein [Proteinivorax tanatarense]|uniref:FprA family A-type flavoprotein n=1 Tax=Proteinivorax tanatarense TaxID=1260629 RepID=A0AAU7VJA5_9FIRM
MYNSINITKDIFWVGVNDRRTQLFENLWPLDHGVAHNSYLIVDEKVALIDTAAEEQAGDFFRKIESIISTDRKVDYLIVNHMEPDHSGLMKALLQRNPDIKIVGNKKTFGLIESFYGITSNLLEVKEGQEIELGKHTLKFFMAPMVHWPETMVTYETHTKTLFSGDAFGSFGALDGGIFDDEVDLSFFEEEMRRYYSNIVGKYGAPVQRAINKLSLLDINYICSTHGPIWRTEPNKVVSLYDKWSKQEGEEGVVIVYGTMYGNTAKMAELIAQCLSEQGIKNIKLYDSSKTHISYILRDIWKYKGLIIGSCAYNTNLLPPIETLTEKLKHLGLKNKCLGIFGTYSWSGGGVNNLQKFADHMKMPPVSEPVEAKCATCDSDINGLKSLAKKMAEHLKSN